MGFVKKNVPRATMLHSVLSMDSLQCDSFAAQKVVAYCFATLLMCFGLGPLTESRPSPLKYIILRASAGPSVLGKAYCERLF